MVDENQTRFEFAEFQHLRVHSSSPPPEVEMPKYFTQISETSKYCIVAYCIFFVTSSLSNAYVFRSVSKQIRVVKTRTSLLILNLCIADLIVTFFLMPMEIGWRITIQWYGCNVLCKACQFFRAFGLYLSSMVVICISVDRFYAIIYPLKLAGARKRVKVMLGIAWGSAVLFALPQIFVFHVTAHPHFPSFKQCVTKSFMEQNPHEEILYNVFSISALYVAPLVVILFTYSMILCKIHRKSKTEAYFASNNKSRSSLLAEDACKITAVTAKLQLPQNVSKTTATIPRRADRATVMARARVRTLRLTLLILLSFLACWTPYVFMTLWYIFDRKGAQAVNQGVQEGLFLMALGNSILNPLIYGTFKKNYHPTHNGCRRTNSSYSCPYVSRHNQKLHFSSQVQEGTECISNPRPVDESLVTRITNHSCKCKKCKNGY